MKKTLKDILLIVSILILIINIVYITTRAKKNEEQLTCYKTLYNEDKIGNKCDIYFENDSWYIEYKK